MKDETPKDPMNDPCADCGLCCQKLIIEIEHIDVVREPALRDCCRKLDGRGTIEFDSVWETPYLLSLRGCPMLDENKRCTIYPTRPNTCVAFEAGGEHCNELRAAAGLAPLDPIP